MTTLHQHNQLRLDYNHVKGHYAVIDPHCHDVFTNYFIAMSEYIEKLNALLRG